MRRATSRASAPAPGAWKRSTRGGATSASGGGGASSDLGHRGEPLGEALGERALDPLPLPATGGRSRTSTACRRRSSDWRRSAATPVASANPWMRTARAGSTRSGSASSRSDARRRRDPRPPSSAAPHLLLGPGRHPHQRAGALHRGPAGHVGTVEAQRFESRIGMHRLEPGIEKVAGRGRHAAVAVHQIPEPRAQGRLLRGMALGQDLGQGKPPRSRLARPLQDLESEPMESLDEHARRRPRDRSDRRGRHEPAGCAKAPRRGWGERGGRDPAGPRREARPGDPGRQLRRRERRARRGPSPEAKEVPQGSPTRKG